MECHCMVSTETKYFLTRFDSLLFCTDWMTIRLISISNNILSFGLAYISAEYHNNLYYMDILKLGYTKKWIDYGFLTEEILSKQIAEFEKEGTKPVEHYRYTLFVNWLKGKEALNNEEINNFIVLCTDDKDNRMSGSAIKDLFLSDKISDEQFEIIKLKLPQFGEWTEKLITREVLTRRVNRERMSPALFKLCYDYKVKYKDNRLLLNIIKKTNDSQCLAFFSELDVGKKLKKLAKNKLTKLN